jgi:uncharacterized protein
VALPDLQHDDGGAGPAVNLRKQAILREPIPDYAPGAAAVGLDSARQPTPDRKATHVPGKFVLRRSSAGYHFNLLARNGRVIATSEVYDSRPAALVGIKSVRTNAPDAVLVEDRDAANGATAGTKKAPAKATATKTTAAKKSTTKKVAAKSTPAKTTQEGSKEDVAPGKEGGVELTGTANTTTSPRVTRRLVRLSGRDK